jgi:murein peptide amidase A
VNRLGLVPLLAAALLLGSLAAPSAFAATGGVTSSANALAIGLSVQGRAIDIGCLGDGERTVLVVGGIHTGTESVSTELAIEMAALLWGGGIELPSDVRVCVLPSLNPDGIALGLHTNARSVDLNRNWPAANWTGWAYHPETGPVSGGSEPLSEPETRALYEYISETRPELVVVYHCCGSVVEANSVSGASGFGLTYAAAAGFSYINTWQLYSITGQFIDAMDGLGIAAIDIELASPSDTGIAEHRDALIAVLASLDDEPPQLASPEAPSEVTLYIVQPGDTLANIAFRFGVNVDALAWANGITNPELIEVGDALAIP